MFDPLSGKRSIKKIAYYISAHGYGHAARSAAVLHALGNRYRVQIKTAIPDRFFKDRGLNHEIIHQQVDTGCVQANFSDIDINASWSALRRFLDQHAELFDREVQWLEHEGINLVISDVPPLPLAAARALDRPGLLVANFTWHDIYSHFPGAEQNTDLLDCLADDYAAATLQFLPQCHLANQVTGQKVETGMIALQGQNIRTRLQELLPDSLASRRFIFLYAGEYDASMIQWNQLEAMQDCVFFTRDPLPSPAQAENLILLDDRFDYPDLVASCDLVVTKGGYSTLATAFFHGVPVLSCERPDFKEFEAVAAFVQDRAIGGVIDKERFYRGDWAKDVKKCLQMTAKNKVPLNGEQAVVTEINRRLAPESIQTP